MLCFLTAFISGFVILSLEMLGFRFLAPYFGYSTYVWGGLLGVIMAALSAGYYFGGILVDKRPQPKLVFDLVLYSTLYLILIRIFYKELLNGLVGSGIILGSVLGTALLFGPSMILLGMLSPFLIRLLARENTLGVTTGKIFAVSTLGSLFGTFLTSFILIPKFGSLKTLTGLILMLLTLFIAGNIGKRKMVVGISLFIITLFVPGEKNEQTVVYKTESAYNLIQVRKEKENFFLHLNDSAWLQSIYREGYVSTGSYYDFMLLGKFFTNCRDILILGAGAGTSARQFLHFVPQSQIDAVEIDPKVIEVGYKFFGLPKNNKLNIIIEDARPYLSMTEKTYDLVEIDTFAGGPFIPFYLATREFFELVYRRLNPSGWMIMNVITSKGHDKLSNHLGLTLKKVFPSLFILELGENNLFFAPRDAESLKNFKTRLSSQTNSKLATVIQHALEYLKEFQPKERAVIFTDDYAPTEKLIYEMIKDEYLKVS